MVNKDFELFKKEFKKWQDKFGLNGWVVYFKYEQLEDSFASSSTDINGMVATIKLNSKLPNKDKPFKNIKRSAKHEALHLLLARMSCNAYARFVSRDDLYESEEELVHKLEGLL